MAGWALRGVAWAEVASGHAHGICFAQRRTNSSGRRSVATIFDCVAGSGFEDFPGGAGAGFSTAGSLVCCCGPCKHDAEVSWEQSSGLWMFFNRRTQLTCWQITYRNVGRSREDCLAFPLVISLRSSLRASQWAQRRECSVAKVGSWNDSDAQSLKRAGGTDLLPSHHGRGWAVKEDCRLVN